MPNIDFEGNEVTNTNPNNSTPQQEPINPANEPDTTHLNGGGTEDVTSKDNNSENKPNPTNPNNPNNEDNKSQIPHQYEEGTEVEFDGVTYKVDNKGNLVDSNNAIFKKADEVEQWLKDNNFVDNEDNNDLSIDSIKSVVGVEITDETGNPIEFTNDAAGVKNYVESVINLKANELQQGAINKLYQDNPLLKQFIDYVQLTGSARGFGEIPDRSGIELDKDNEAQLEAVIKMAATEFGNKSLNDNYIKYLKNTGTLYEEAKIQLEALVNKDIQVRKDIETKAEAARQQELAEVENYWKGVNNAIKDRRIAGYLLPETIVKEHNGQKITYKLDDFYSYVAKGTEMDSDGNRITGYRKDLNNLSDKELLERELLDAWLLWTGGSYKDLVNMAINEDKVRKLVAKSKENNATRHIKVNKPTQSGDKTKLMFE